MTSLLLSIICVIAACPDAAGNEVVIYHFQQTKAGWKFTELDNLNE